MTTRLSKDRGVLVLVDVQERLFPAMRDAATVASRLEALARGAVLFGMPRLLTVQNPEKLGGFDPALRAAAGDPEPIPKATFSCAREPAFMESLRETERDQVLLAGIETHVCVQATCLDLLDQGWEVVVVADATSSRLAHTGPLGLDRMRQAGAALSSVEGALFEMLERWDDPVFRALLPLVKEGR